MTAAAATAMAAVAAAEAEAVTEELSSITTSEGNILISVATPPPYLDVTAQGASYSSLPVAQQSSLLAGATVEPSVVSYNLFSLPSSSFR